ncbi:hypothetical protein MPER_14353, partial [Moniliophthora perniciosa FA553]
PHSDNEYNEKDGAAYFAELEAAYRDPNSGVVVPLTYNDPNMGRNFINGTIFTGSIATLKGSTALIQIYGSQ